MTWLLVRIAPVEVSTMPVPAAVPPWKPRIEFTSTTEGSTAAAIAAAVRALGGEAAACGEGAAALGDGATGGTTTGAEGDAAALGAKPAGGAGEGGVDVATGRCGNPPTTAYDSATTRTTTARTMTTTRKAAPLRRGGLGVGTPGGPPRPPAARPVSRARCGQR